MQLIEIRGDNADIQFSSDEITILNNSLNEVCHGVKIIDFDSKIGVSREEARRLLNSAHELMNELRLHRQINKTLKRNITEPNSYFTTKEKCYLEASGYQVGLYIRSLDSSKDHIGLVIVLVVNTDFGEISLRTPAQKILIHELQNLIEYLEQHIASLRKNPDNNSSTLFSCQNAFQVHALSGNVISEDEGSFTLRFMVNVGHQKDRVNTSTTYAGAEAVVSFENLQSFTSSIKTVLSRLSYSA